jgi:toxin ParE1/3/4
LQAERDLAKLYTHIAFSHPSAAKTYLAGLSTQLYKLASLGISGAPRDWIAPGLRAFPYKSHCIYFRMTDDKMIILRIVHGSRDISAQLFSDVPLPPPS